MVNKVGPVLHEDEGDRKGNDDRAVCKLGEGSEGSVGTEERDTLRDVKVSFGGSGQRRVSQGSSM